MAGTRSAEALACPECGKQYDTPQGLGGHRHRTHGVRSSEAIRRERLGLAPKAGRKRVEQKSDGRESPIARLPIFTPEELAQQVVSGGFAIQALREQLRDLASPLRSQLMQIERQMTLLDEQTRELREARNEIRSVLAKLDPDSVEKPAQSRQSAVSNANTARAERQLQEKVDAVASLLATDDRFADGFTANTVADELSKQIPRGLSPKSARRILDRLRDGGIVRHDRVVRGGGMQFKLVTSTNGDRDGS